MPVAMLILIGCQFVGDVIVKAASLPLPGMIVGLVLLFASLWLRGRWLGPEKAVPDALSRLAKGLHDNLGLLFVPAGVGIMANLHSLAADAVGLFVAVILSTLVTVGVTALAAGRRGARRSLSAVAAP